VVFVFKDVVTVGDFHWEFFGECEEVAEFH
jgi:hypothetical protein